MITKLQDGICDLGLRLIERATLSTGGHSATPPIDPAEPCECCVMELRSQALHICGLLEGEENSWWSDMPAGDSKVIGRFLQVCNDRWIPRDAKYGEDLKQFAVMDLRHKGPEIEQQRMFLAADWAVRTIAPMRFEYRGKPKKAQEFRDLTPITDKASAYAAYAYAAADAAAAAADDAADDAAAAAAAYAYRESLWQECLSVVRQMIALGEPA